MSVNFKVAITRDVRRADGSFTFAPFDLSALEEAGIAWDFLPIDPPNADVLGDIDGLYHFAAPLPSECLLGVDRLAVVARHGVGLDSVDVTACTNAGIAVTITPTAVTRPMASSAVALVLALAHRLVERNKALHEGDWTAARFALQGTGLAGRTLGIVGYGRIGQEVVRLLRPWGMRVLVTQRTSVTDEGVTFVSLPTVLEEADFLVICCPLTDETRGLINVQRLRTMKPTAFLVNVARGAVVDQQALVDALQSGRLAGAGLDVVDPEPLPADDPLLALTNVIGAPHSLGYTDELLAGCVAQACEALIDVAAGRVPNNLANPEVVKNPHFIEKLRRYS